MKNRELALEMALGSVVLVASKLGIRMTLLAKAKAELLGQTLSCELVRQHVQEAIYEIELADPTQEMALKASRVKEVVT